MKKTTKYVLCGIFILTFFASCKINEWNSPWWDVTLVTPLVNDTFAILDLRSDENFVFDDYQVSFVTKDDIDDAEIEDGELKISPNAGAEPLALVSSSIRGYIPVTSDEDDVQLVYGFISRGKLDFEFTSISENINYITIIFDEILDNDNNRKRVRVRRQSSNFSYERSLVGYKFQSLESGDELIELLNFTVTVESSGGANTSGFMRIYYEDNIYFSSIYGILDNLRVDTENVINNIDIEWPINIEHAIRIKNPKMVININNYLNFPATFNATVTAFNTRSNLRETFDISFPIEPTYDIEVGTRRVITIVSVPSDPSFLVRPIDTMMNIAPDRIEVTNAHMMIVNPNKDKRHARVGIAFYGDLETTVPFDLVFRGEPVFPATPETIEISKNNRENIEKRVENAAIRVVLSNRYSLGGTMQLHFSSSPHHDFMYGDESISGHRLVIKEDRLQRPLYVEKATNINTPYVETYYIDLTRDELKMFHMHEEIYFGFKIVFDRGETTVRPDESINIIARLIATVMVDFD